MGLILSSVASAERGPYDWALIRLDYARREKVTQLRSFCDRLHTLALQAAQDPFVVACFDINRQYAEAIAKGPVPEALVERVTQLREGFNDYYIRNYFAFYDILFVNTQGQVFYTIRKESDLNVDLAQETATDNALTRCLRTVGEDEAFVDFHNYEPSSKPAAFFVEPVYRDGTNLLGPMVKRIKGFDVYRCERHGVMFVVVAAASQEQAQGIDQVNTAVSQMDKVTQQNAANAEESASASEELSSQAESMNAIVAELVTLVGGAAGKGQSSPSPCPSRQGKMSQSDHLYHQIAKPTQDKVSRPATPSQKHPIPLTAEEELKDFNT